MSGGVSAVDPGMLADPATFRALVMVPGQPMLLPGAARSWPLLAGGAPAILDTLRRFDAGREAEIFIGQPEIDARYYYDPSLAGFNFTRESVTFAEGLRRIAETAGRPGRETIYMGSLPSERYLPGIEELAHLPFLPASVRPRFWIGHESRVACHYDTMDNVACVAAGRRRFTLYPPQAIADLYAGPIDHTMAGQPVALAVDSEPGDPRFPRFESIRDSALVVDL